MKIRVLLIWCFYALLSFPLFYFVYKFGNPMFGANDFFSYYKLYLNWDFASVEAPFNMRLLSSSAVYLLNKAGLHYDTETVFDQFNMSRQVYFNAVFFNYLCVISVCVVLFQMVQQAFGNILLSATTGLLYLLGFGTIFYELMPITDSLSVLLFVLAFKSYQGRSYYVLIPLVLAVFQREYIFMAFWLITFVDFLRFRDRYYIFVFAGSVLFFVIYYLLRKTIFYTPMYDHQASAGYFADSLVKLKFPLIPYLKQTMMTLNLFFLYLFVIIYKLAKRVEFDRWELVKILLLFVQINVVSFAAVFGNNTGRYFYILVPLIIFQIIKEFRPFISNQLITANPGAGD